MAYILPDNKADTRGHITSSISDCIDKLTEVNQLLKDPDGAPSREVCLQKVMETRTLLAAAEFALTF